MRTVLSPSTSYSATSSSSDSDSTATVRKGRVAKISKERRERREVMGKLQKMVPMAREGDSQLKLLQDVMDYIVTLQQQLEDDLADSENRKLQVEVSNLSTLFARFSTKSARLPLRPGQQLISH